MTRGLNRKVVTISSSVALAAAVFSGTADAQPTHLASLPHVAPASAQEMMTNSARATLRLPDGRRTADVWKTWSKNANGKYHGHYGFTSASHDVQIFAVLWTSGTVKYLPTEGKSYSYSNESSVRLYACYRYTTNDQDCTGTW